MAVYTEVTDEALRAFLADYELGGLVAFRGIAEGREFNFALKTEAGISSSPCTRSVSIRRSCRISSG